MKTLKVKKAVKAIIIINWSLSFCALCVDTERTPFLGVLIIMAWFVVSSFLLLFMDKRSKQFNFELFNRRLEKQLSDETV
jgi:maltodextrin utilization protein YvdJ